MAPRKAAHTQRRTCPTAIHACPPNLPLTGGVRGRASEYGADASRDGVMRERRTGLGAGVNNMELGDWDGWN